MKKNLFYIWFSLSVIVFALLAIPNVKAQGYGDRNRASEFGGSYTIQGRVVLPDGRPAVGVKISISATDFVSSSTVTDFDGAFTFSGLMAGNFNISVKGGAEYEPDAELLSIERGTPSGQHFNVAFYLRPLGVKKSKDNPTNNPLLNDVPKDALKKYKSATDSAKKNDFKAAVAFLDEAIVIYPKFAFAYNEKGMYLLKQNELKPALEAFVKAIEIKPDYFDAKLNFGFTLLNMKDYEKTEMVMRDVLKQRPESSPAQMYLGIALIGLKKIDEAETTLKKVVSTKSGENLAQAHRYLGGIYIQKKNNAEAVAELEKYLQLVPKAPDAEKIKTTIAELKKQSN